jgi:hypothetical protein
MMRKSEIAENFFSSVLEKGEGGSDFPRDFGTLCLPHSYWIILRGEFGGGGEHILKGHLANGKIFSEKKPPARGTFSEKCSFFRDF